MAQLNKVRLPDGREFSPGDWTASDPLYSTVEIGPGSFPVVTAFSYTEGETVPGSPTNRSANKADTNLRGEGNRLPEDEEILIYSMSIEAFTIGQETAVDGAIFPPDAPDVSLSNMLRLQRDIMIIARIGGYKTEYARSPLSWFPASTGVKQYNSGARSNWSDGANGYIAANNGDDQVWNTRRFASPYYIRGGESFAVDFQPGPGQVNDLALTGNSRIRCRLFFEGYRKRPVA